jgi:hypothetical protein
MADETPRGNWAVFAFLEMFALAFAFQAVEKFGSDRPASVWGGYAIAALVFFVAGITWPRIQVALGGDYFVRFIEWLAGYRVLIVIAVAAYIAFTKSDPRYRYGALGGAAAYALLNSIAYVRAIRRDLDRYAMPRRLTAPQARKLSQALGREDHIAIRVHVDPHDAEALHYAGELFAAFLKAEWGADLNTAAPYGSGDGLRILIAGVNHNHPETHIPQTQALQRAFALAQVRIESAGAYAGGQYCVILEVGSRPLTVSRGDSLLTKLLNKLARSIVQLGRRL